MLTLVNNWPDYGGMAQYVSWFLGLPDDYGAATNHDMFYSTRSIQDCYRAYVKYVLTRFNRYTGLRYNEDPTIMTFELANEPRSRSDKTGQQLLTWVTQASAYFKHLAPHQLVTTGDEGFYGDPANSDYPYSNYEGDRWKDFLALPAIDYGTVHLYPQGWGEPVVQAGHRPGQLGHHLDHQPSVRRGRAGQARGDRGVRAGDQRRQGHRGTRQPATPATEPGPTRCWPAAVRATSSGC